jgi:hypothetical protein
MEKLIGRHLYIKIQSSDEETICSVSKYFFFGENLFQTS